jgi:ubiquinone/menaquinone biosynthesis C-methylase UbiE
MGRTHDIIRFVEYEEGSNLVIEPRQRHQHVRERLLDVVKTYNPRVIVKAGLGRGELLLDLASSSDAVIVVVDYSCDAMNRFRQAHRDTSVLERVHFVAGDFSSFPVDYYAADLLLCVDYFDFIETGTAIDEFRRSLQFEGILFIADDVLHEEDLNGAYDDLTAMLFPLHNDYISKATSRLFCRSTNSGSSRAMSLPLPWTSMP